MELHLSGKNYDPDFLQKIEKESGQNVNLCFQCKKCTAGCPAVWAMDLTPTQIIHAARLGLKDLVFNSKTIWFCLSCETCTTRCPQDVDIAKVMDAARILAQKEKVKPKVPEVVAFYKSSIGAIKRFGRIYELGLIGELKLRTRNFFQDLALGMKMFRKRKLKIFPKLVNVIAVNKMLYKIKKMEKTKK
jgi:heterodisulfide reductase subunit C